MPTAAARTTHVLGSAFRRRLRPPPALPALFETTPVVLYLDHRQTGRRVPLRWHPAPLPDGWVNDGVLEEDGAVRFDKLGDWSRDTLRDAGDWEVRAGLHVPPHTDMSSAVTLVVYRMPGGPATQGV